MAVTARRRDALRRGVRLEQGRRLRHARSSRHDTFVPSAANQIASAAAARPASCSTSHERRLYVLTRFDNAISVRRHHERSEVAHVPLHNPEPASVMNGRPLPLRRALIARATATRRARAATSSATSTAWPGTSATPTTGDSTILDRSSARSSISSRISRCPEFHPMKGPMTTQSLRGMANHGPMHWRGDRTGGQRRAHGAARRRHLRRGRGVQEVQAGVRRICSAAASSSPTPTCRRSPTSSCRSPIRRTRSAPSTTRSPPTRRPARLLLRHVIRRRYHHLQRLPRARSAGQSQRRSTRASSAPTGARASRTRRSLQDRRTCATCTRRSACSACRRSPFGILAGDNGHKGDQVRGFGFLHDGSIDTLFRFMRGSASRRSSASPFRRARSPIIPMASRTTRQAISSAATSSHSCSRSTAIWSP